MTAPLSDDEIQAALAAEIECAPWCNSNYASGGPGCDCLDTHRRPAAAALIPVVRGIAAREAARELEAAAEQIAEARDVCPNAERRQGYGGSLVVLRARARALGLDPTHGKATT